jgi:hypothetical protein
LCEFLEICEYCIVGLTEKNARHQGVRVTPSPEITGNERACQSGFSCAKPASKK